MKILWDEKWPLAMFMVAESDRDKVLVAMMRKGASLSVYTNAPDDIYPLARKALSEVPLEQAERTARVMMDSDLKCGRHPGASDKGCAACLGIVSIGVGVIAPGDEKAAGVELDPFASDHPSTDIPF